MIPALVAIQVLSAHDLNPTWVFAGERVTVQMRDATPVTFAGEANLSRRSVTDSSWTGSVLKQARASLFVYLPGEARDSPRDAKEIEIPVALCSKWERWPESGRMQDRVAFLIGEHTNIACLPTTTGHAILISSRAGERRLSPIVSFDIAVRFGPKRPRRFDPDYAYAGQSGITLIGSPDNVLRASVRINEQMMSLDVAAIYDLEGTFTTFAASQPVPIKLRSGERMQWTHAIPTPAR